MEHQKIDYIQVEVVYAGEHKQSMIPLRIIKGTTVAEIIQQSDILALHPDLQLNQVGIWGKQVDLSESVTQEGARIEIYRPLLIDPKQARLKRVN
jgi:putative ubiquitin-RnfH superfamily antitoxin RatB of RatAB toxin-antitoxin module